MASTPSAALERLRIETQTLEKQMEAMRARIAAVASQREHAVASVDNELCTRCGICASICPRQAIVIENEVMIDTERCSGCGACMLQCPTRALQLVRVNAPPEGLSPAV
jgi:ferredoxin